MAESVDCFGYNQPLIKLKTFFSYRARLKMHGRFIKICEPGRDSEILDRARVQFALAADMERRSREMREILREQYAGG